MSGTLLLINRNPGRRPEFARLQQRLERFNDLFFAGHFQSIQTHTPDPDTCVVEYRKDNRAKFHHDPADGSWLTFEGHVFALSETRALEGAELLAWYRQDPASFPNRLDGHFVIKLYDAQRQQYRIINDFIKNKTNFQCQTDDYFLFTPFLLPTALILAPQPDWEAFNEFMWRYYILSQRSILKGVVRLSPATVYTVEKSRITAAPYWHWPHHYTRLGFTDAVEQLVTSMQESARLIHYSFGKPAADFTMGQDSRQVISAFTSQQLPLATATFGKSDFYEVVHVAAMARRHGIEHHPIQLEQDYFDQLGSMFVRAMVLGNCEQPGHLLGRILYMKNRYRQFGAVSLNGSDGHFYKNGLWDELYTFNFYREPARFAIGTFLELRALSHNYPDAFFAPAFLDLKAGSRDYFTRLASDAIADYLTAPVSIQVDRFDLYHWLNFGIAGNNAINIIFDHISPLILRRNLELALQIPVQWKFNLSKLQRAIVFRLDPQLAAEPTDFGGVNLLPKQGLDWIPFYIRYYYHQSARLRNKIKSKLGLKIITHLQEAWDYRPVYEQLYRSPEMQNCLQFANLIHCGLVLPDPWSDWRRLHCDPPSMRLDDFEYLFKIASVESFLSLARQAAEIR